MAIPKGVRSRVTPDWFAQNLCVAGYGITTGGFPSNRGIGLYNDSASGWVLAIYATQIVANQSLLANVYFLSGTVGTQVNAGSRINPALAAPPGAMYYLDSGGSLFSGNPVCIVSSFSGANWNASYPQFVIPPGNMVFIAGQEPDDRVGLSFFYVPFTDASCREAR